jgi:hypothetical protein
MQKLALIGRIAAIVLGVGASSASAQAADDPRVIEIIVHNGCQPEEITLVEGERVKLRFIRHDEGGCTRAVVFPSLGIRRELPTGQPVEVELGPLPSGEVEFRCGEMGMEMPKNSVSRKGAAGPFGFIDMGGMFTIIKIRDRLEGNQDPGWYKHPEGTVASAATKEQLRRDGIDLDDA